jgi:tetratricopeptide (TPR) repeat protein
MNESEYIKQLQRLCPKDDDMFASAEAMALSEQAVAEHPESSVLWCIRGDFLQLASDDYETDDQPEACYRRAVELDPTNGQAWEELGCCLEAVSDEFEEAVEAFLQAIEHGGGGDSCYGLARALAQLGEKEQALAAVDQAIEAGITATESFEELREEIESDMWSPEPQ